MDRLIPASKSEMIRGLILKSWKPELKVLGVSQALDIQHSQDALRHFLNSDPSAYYFGDSALGLRLWMARLSRKPGEYVLEGSPRLRSRPHQELVKLLKRLSVRVQILNDSFKIISNGWKLPTEPLYFDFSKSSQFASAILMNAWALEKELAVQLHSLPSYFKLTLETLKTAGLKYDIEKDILTVPSGQKIALDEFETQPDLSTAFTLAAWALAEKKEVLLKGFPPSSHQPDFKFVEILKKMGAQITAEAKGLRVKPSTLSAIEVELKEIPDLFPVLCVLAGIASGTSVFWGLDTLRWKESHRLKQGIKLLKLMNRNTSLHGDHLTIHGEPFRAKDQRPFTFDPDEDHRFVMAAQTARLAGFPVKIVNPHAIRKTAPELLPEVMA